MGSELNEPFEQGAPIMRDLTASSWTGLDPSFGLKTSLAVEKYKICQRMENRKKRVLK